MESAVSLPIPLVESSSSLSSPASFDSISSSDGYFEYTYLAKPFSLAGLLLVESGWPDVLLKGAYAHSAYLLEIQAVRGLEV